MPVPSQQVTTSQGRVHNHGTTRHHPLFGQLMVITATYGAQVLWRMAPMWWLPLTEQCQTTILFLIFMTHQLSSLVLPFFEGRPCLWVPPDPSQWWRHPKNSHYYSFQSFWILCMPFGLKNVAQAFQWLMDMVCKDLPFVFVYVDDILIASLSTEEHCTHLRTLFQWLANNGLLLNPNKCEFGCTEIDFLSYHISPDGIKPNPPKVMAIHNLQWPANKKELQQFAGMMNFYHHCIPYLAELMKPIYAAMSNSSKMLLWTTELQNVFCNSKTALTNATLLHHLWDQAPTALTTDASNSHRF